MFKNKNGFTVVELVVVIVVVGILASLVVVTSSSYIQRANEAKVKNSLIAAVSEIKKNYNRTGEYPAELSSSFSDVKLISGGAESSFCVISYTPESNIVFHMTQDDSKPQEGACDIPDPESEPEPESLAVSVSPQNITVEVYGPAFDYPLTVSNIMPSGGAPPYSGWSYSLKGGIFDQGCSSLRIDSFTGPNNGPRVISGAAKRPGFLASSSCELTISVNDSTNATASKIVDIEIWDGG